MNDLEKDLKKLMDTNERQYQAKEREYVRLTASSAISVGLAVCTYLLTSGVSHLQPHWRYALTGAAAAVILSTFISLFLVRAYRSELGISGYLRIERTLLINEMPNIFQILSLLGFLNVLLKQQVVKIIVSVVITFLLMIYLTSKRRDMVAASPRLAEQDKVAGNVTALLTLVLGSIIGTVVYALASLISVQIT